MDLKTIELAGIVRNLPDNRVADGTMQEIINLRPEDGAWRPVGPKESYPMATSDVRFIHTINESFKVYLGTPGGSLWYWVYENGIIQVSVNTGIVLTGKQITFAQLHKTIIVSNITDKVMITMIFDIPTQQYKVFTEGLPELPDITITLQTPLVGYPFPSTINKTGLDDSEKALAWAMTILEQTAKHTFTGPVALRFAWELSDGNIVKHSAPILIETSYFSLASATSLDWTGKYIQLTTTSGAALIALSKKWKGIISSLNIYATRQATPTEGIGDIVPIYKDLSIAEETNYYLVKSIPIDDLELIFLHYLLDDYREIETFPVMPADNFTHHTIHASSFFPYNERIFMGDITTKLYSAFSPSTFIEPITGGVTGVNYVVVFEVDLLTSDGLKTVAYTWASINYYKSAAEPTVHAFKIKRYLSYPDARATTIRIIVDTVTSGTPKLVATLKLTPQNYLNFAWYNEISSGSPLIYGGFQFVGPLSSYPDLAAWSVVNNEYSDSNRIQTTEQSNPFYFPAINSYRCGNGKVIGMATNAVALSQGQFGQFPVYVFTTDGIWALTIGSGDPLIQSIVPVSREVCNNARSITQIDGGVAFTTDKGLYILSGASPVEISDPAEGRHLSRLTGTVNYEAIANNPNLYQVKAYLCTMSLLSYLQGAALGYDHIHKEIIASNPSKNYSWVFSIRSKMWYKISESWERFVHDFPRVYGYRSISTAGTTPFLASSTDIGASDDTVLASAEFIEGTITYQLCDISLEDFTALVPVHMETRPLKISANKYKKIIRLLIGGRVSDSIINPFSVNLFGSPDDKSWYLMNNGHAFGNKNRLLIGRSLFSCQYFILVFGGMVDEDAYFTHLEVEFEERFGGKLR